MSNLQLRVLSAVVMAALVLAVTFWGGLPARLLAAALAVAMLHEWLAMVRGGVDRRLVALAFVALLAAMAPMVFGLGAAVAFATLGVGLAVVLVAARVLEQGTAAGSGLVYAALSGLSLGYLRGDDHAGLVAILFLFAVVWSTDVLAYFVGRSLGGPKLAPAISPGKTWSGALGGAAGGVLGGLLLAAAAGVGPLPLLGLVALLLSMVAQAGDLFESAIKRRNGVKDSGNLIPGHGGVMDRVDGLVAAAIALYLIGWLLAGADLPAHGLFLP
ncbi:MAG: phosphatidate cytidylyltransferase [Rhizobiaceae bacterium]|nr:phosphatidate cytidylyltransferase [Rhizobiaceae bacterium]